MRIRNVENKVFYAKFLTRLLVHNVLKDSQNLLPKGDYERRHGAFPRYFSGWYLFVTSKDLAEGEIVHKKLNGLDLICYRGRDGKPVVHSNRCPHMDGLFAMAGEVKNGRLICGYHRYAYEAGKPRSGPRSFRDDPAMCIPTFPVREVNDLVMFWFDADADDGIGEPTWALDLPDVTDFTRRHSMRSITPTHMAPLHENIVDDSHFVQLHKSRKYKAELKVYHDKHRFSTKNTMVVPNPRLGRLSFFSDVPGEDLEIRMDTDFHGLGIHINHVRVGGFEAKVIHCTTPIEDEVTEWTVTTYVKRPRLRLRRDTETMLAWLYPLTFFGRTYYLHTQDRRAFFEHGEYRFYDEVPEGFEKVNAFRRWIHEELLGEERPWGPNSMPTKYEPRSAAK